MCMCLIARHLEPQTGVGEITFNSMGPFSNAVNGLCLLTPTRKYVILCINYVKYTFLSNNPCFCVPLLFNMHTMHLFLKIGLFIKSNFDFTKSLYMNEINEVYLPF